MFCCVCWYLCLFVYVFSVDWGRRERGRRAERGRGREDEGEIGKEGQKDRVWDKNRGRKLSLKMDGRNKTIFSFYWYQDLKAFTVLELEVKTTIHVEY